MRATEIVQHENIVVMERHGVGSIFSFDADFDRWHGLKRIH